MPRAWRGGPRPQARRGRGLDAVTQGLTTSWSSGPVEGRVNLNIKMLKRQMFDRAGLPLLRERVLLTAKN